MSDETIVQQIEQAEAALLAGDLDRARDLAEALAGIALDDNEGADLRGRLDALLVDVEAHGMDFGEGEGDEGGGGEEDDQFDFAPPSQVIEAVPDDQTPEAAAATDATDAAPDTELGGHDSAEAEPVYTDETEEVFAEEFMDETDGTVEAVDSSLAFDGPPAGPFGLEDDHDSGNLEFEAAKSSSGYHDTDEAGADEPEPIASEILDPADIDEFFDSAAGSGRPDGKGRFGSEEDESDPGGEHEAFESVARGGATPGGHHDADVPALGLAEIELDDAAETVPGFGTRGMAAESLEFDDGSLEGLEPDDDAFATAYGGFSRVEDDVAEDDGRDFDIAPPADTKFDSHPGIIVAGKEPDRIGPGGEFASEPPELAMHEMKDVDPEAFRAALAGYDSEVENWEVNFDSPAGTGAVGAEPFDESQSPFDDEELMPAVDGEGYDQEAFLGVGQGPLGYGEENEDEDDEPLFAPVGQFDSDPDATAFAPSAGASPSRVGAAAGVAQRSAPVAASVAERGVHPNFLSAPLAANARATTLQTIAINPADDYEFIGNRREANRWSDLLQAIHLSLHPAKMVYATLLVLAAAAMFAGLATLARSGEAAGIPVDLVRISTLVLALGIYAALASIPPAVAHMTRGQLEGRRLQGVFRSLRLVWSAAPVTVVWPLALVGVLAGLVFGVTSVAGYGQNAAEMAPLMYVLLVVGAVVLVPVSLAAFLPTAIFGMGRARRLESLVARFAAQFRRSFVGVLGGTVVVLLITALALGLFVALHAVLFSALDANAAGGQMWGAAWPDELRGAARQLAQWFPPLSALYASVDLTVRDAPLTAAATGLATTYLLVVAVFVAYAISLFFTTGTMVYAMLLRSQERYGIR